MSRLLCIASLVLLTFATAATSHAQRSRFNRNRSSSSSSTSTRKVTIPDAWMDKIKFRSIGPANMMGRIVSIAVYEKDPSRWWAASASGGLIKTVNNGTTFEHQFDDQSTVSIGDVQVAQSNPDILWVGTGEANPRNSVSWGDGVYKSVDGGKTWKNMGLKESFQIGRIAIHPKNPDIVYVGALGRLWGPSEQRGLFKTTDGGKTWKKILFVDDKTGIIDVQMHPKNPDILYVATYERKRDGFDGNDPIKKYGDGSGIYKTTDGGETFNKLTDGLPTCKMGRIGLQIYRKNPKYIYAIIETEKIAKSPVNFPYLGLRVSEAEVGVKISSAGSSTPAGKAGLKRDDIILEVAGKKVKNQTELSKCISKGYKAGDKVKFLISRDRTEKTIEVTLGKYRSRRGRDGIVRSSNRTFVGTLGGQSANHQDSQWHDEDVDPAEYGGVYMSSNSGKSWKRINTLNPRPMYYSQLRVDPSDNKYIYVCGTSLYKSKDGGKTFTSDGLGASREVHVDNHAMWINPNDGKNIILGNDGGIYVTHDRMLHWDHYNHVALGQFYHVGVGPGRNYKVYGGLQDNGSWGGPSSNGTGEILNTDWFRVGGGDGFICLVDPNDKDLIYFESQNGMMQRVNMRTGERGFIRPAGGRGPNGQRLRYRFNWKTPFILSPQNSRIHYSAGNYVFRSLDRGNRAKAISPEITNTNKGSGSAITQSPQDAGILYVGTTDGAVWMTRDGGRKWVPLYSTKGRMVADASKSKNPVAEKEQKTTKPAAKTETKNTSSSSKFAAVKKAVEGSWEGAIRNFEFTLNLKVSDKGKITGSLKTSRSEFEIVSGKYDAAKKTLELVGESERMEVDIEADLKGGKMSGEIDFGGRFQSDFEATRGGKQVPEKTIEVRQVSELERMYRRYQEEKKSDDSVSGEWEGKFIADFIPEGRGAFSLTLKLNKKNEIKGEYSSTQGEGDIVDGSYDPKTGAIKMTGENDEVSLEFEGKIVKGKMSGKIDVNNEMFNVDFEATRKSKPKAETKKPKTEKKDPKADKADKPGKEDAKLKPPAKDEKDNKKPDDQKSAADSQPKAPTGKGSLASLLPGPRWVSSLEASRFSAKTCYISFDGHRSNDDTPYVFKTDDYGKTWQSIRGNLPDSAGSVRVVREDVVNRNVLYLGCEFSAWVSIDRGKSWTQFKGGFPTVAVHEIAVHPTAGEIVMATHGRSLWVADVTAIRQMSSSRLDKDAHLFKPNSAIRYIRQPAKGNSGTRRFKGQSKGSNAGIYYHIGKEAGEVKLKITDIQGRTVVSMDGEKTEGLHVFNWNLRRMIQRSGSNARFQSRPGGGGQRRFGGGSTVRSGNYLITLTVDGEDYKETIEIIADPGVRNAAIAEKNEILNDFEELLRSRNSEEEGAAKGKQSDF